MKSFLKFQVVIFFIALSLQNVCAQQHPAFWDEIQVFKKQDSLHFSPKHAILFVGSSSFTKWTDVQNYFPGYKIINRGFGGSSLPDVIYYADDIIFRYYPKQIIIYCGENDLAASDTVTAQIVYQRFKKL
ncbi:MAG: G-D-S-L family lipolytic protein, partial [Ginsengibacter sp.]